MAHLLLSTSVWGSSFDGFYIGPAFSATSDHHVLKDKSKKYEQKKVSAVIGYGTTLKQESFPLYLGIEATIPLKNDTFRKELSPTGGKEKHVLTKIFPAEGAVKIGYPLDDTILLYGKIGLVHQKFSHQVENINYRKSWHNVAPLYGAGMRFTVNNQWLLNGEFITYKSNKKSSFSHENKHQRIQITLGYRL